MRVPITGIQMLLAVLAGLLLASCGLRPSGMRDDSLPRADTSIDWGVSWQPAEIERLVEAQLSALTQTADSLSPIPTPLLSATLDPTQPPTSLPSPLPSPVQSPTLPPAQISSPFPTDTPHPSPSVAPSPAGFSENAHKSGFAHLSGFTHLYQNMNNCGPAALAMTLSYWRWPEDLEDYLRDGRQRDLQEPIAQALKPEPQDKSVSAHELAAYVEQATPLKALVRSAGNLDLLKRFTAAGLPVIVQRGLDSYVWMGHYQVISGYDDATELFYVYDSYLGPSNAIPTPNQELLHDWRAFNYTYLVIYPPDRGLEVAAILGPRFDLAQNRLWAVELARDELPGLSGRDLYFGWYNLGTSLVELEDYPAAAGAFDQAFSLYNELPPENRPWRMLWYQTGPYPSYYYAARYADLETLASRTIEEAYEPDKPGSPFIEESFYWRGRACAAQGRTAEAISDFRKALELNPLFLPPAEELRRLGGE